jgi:hypothetical protein
VSNRNSRFPWFPLSAVLPGSLTFVIGKSHKVEMAFTCLQNRELYSQESCNPVGLMWRIIHILFPRSSSDRIRKSSLTLAKPQSALSLRAVTQIINKTIPSSVMIPDMLNNSTGRAGLVHGNGASPPDPPGHVRGP